MIKKVLQINNVTNDITEEKGALIMYLNRYSKDAWLKRGENINVYNDANMGLNIFFKPDNKEPYYIKSFILTRNEIESVFQCKTNVVEDLSYFLAWTSNCMKIYNFGSYDTHDGKINDDKSRIMKCGVHKFTLDNKDSEYDFIGSLGIVCNINNDRLVNYTDSLCNSFINEYNVIRIIS